MTHLIDDKGNVYEKRGIVQEWEQTHGLFGPERDTRGFDQPNVETDMFGRAREATDGFGRSIRARDGTQLYAPRRGDGGGSGGGVGAEGALILGGLAIAAFAIVAAAAVVGFVVVGVYRLLAWCFRGWRSLVNSYPRAMLVVHLLIGMGVAASATSAAGLSLEMRAGGIALVPAAWGWITLTRRLPLVLMPINALALGAGLWWAASSSEPEWGPTWGRLTHGLPAVGHLPAVLAVLPIAIWFWTLGQQRWPAWFVAPNLVIVGMGLWFALMRVWTAWQPAWDRAIEPVPVFPPPGALILTAPLLAWGWHFCQLHRPRELLIVNLLVVGGLLSLTATHTEPRWQSTWAHWAGEFPLAGQPILLTGVAPLTLWAWERASHWRPTVFVIPNLVLIGGSGWLILDRTRPAWQREWDRFWGPVPLRPDAAVVALTLPLAVWGWRQIETRWPSARTPVRAAALGVALGWCIDRSRTRWIDEWLAFNCGVQPDPAVVALVAPLIVVAWHWVRARERRVTLIGGWFVGMAALGWLLTRLVPDASTLIVTTIALLPLAGAGCWRAACRWPRAALAVTAIPLLVLAGWIAATSWTLNGVVDSLLSWLITQGLPLD